MPGTSCEIIDLQTLVPWDQPSCGRVGSTDRSSRRRRGGAVDGRLEQRHRRPHLRRAVRLAAGSRVADHLSGRPGAAQRRTGTALPAIAGVRGGADVAVDRDQSNPGAVVGRRGEVVTVTHTEIAVDRRAALQGSRLEQLARMVEIRLVEETVQTLYNDGHIRGSTHLANGQEAVSVGIATVARPDRHRRLHLPRAWHRAGARRDSRGRPRRDLRTFDRVHRRDGRLDAPRGHVRRAAADIRHRRGRRTGRRRGGPDRLGARHRRCGDRHLRRRGGEHRSVPRRSQPGRHPQAAGGVRV